MLKLRHIDNKIPIKRHYQMYTYIMKNTHNIKLSTLLISRRQPWRYISYLLFETGNCRLSQNFAASAVKEDVAAGIIFFCCSDEWEAKERERSEGRAIKQSLKSVIPLKLFAIKQIHTYNRRRVHNLWDTRSCTGCWNLLKSIGVPMLITDNRLCPPVNSLSSICAASSHRWRRMQ